MNHNSHSSEIEAKVFTELTGFSFNSAINEFEDTICRKTKQNQYFAALYVDLINEERWGALTLCYYPKENETLPSDYPIESEGYCVVEYWLIDDNSKKMFFVHCVNQYFQLINQKQ